MGYYQSYSVIFRENAVFLVGTPLLSRRPLLLIQDVKIRSASESLSFSVMIFIEVEMLVSAPQ